MLPLVLQSPMVADWEPASYDTRTYHTFDLRKGDQAFIVESSAFVRIGLRSLKRVQNPYQMGRFQLRKEQREFREDSIKMVRNAQFYKTFTSVIWMEECVAKCELVCPCSNWRNTREVLFKYCTICLFAKQHILCTIQYTIYDIFWYCQFDTTAMATLNFIRQYSLDNPR